MMRRGLVRQQRRLRRAAMLTGLLGAAKIVLIDLRHLAETFCTAGVCGGWSAFRLIFCHFDGGNH